VQEHTKERIIGLIVCLFATSAGLVIALISYGSVYPATAYANSVSSPTNTPEVIGVVSSINVDRSVPQDERDLPGSPHTPTSTVEPTATTTPEPSFTPLPAVTEIITAVPTIPPTATPRIVLSGYLEDCEAEIYSGIQHCTLGPYEILRVDPKHPEVRFETVLPLGFDRYGNYTECRDVHVPDTINPEMSPGPGCHRGNGYPGERVADMAARYPGAVAAFNGDFFSPTYAHGPTGLTVKNGERLDGYFNDSNIREVRRSSLSISKTGEIRIGTVTSKELADSDEPWTWRPDADAYYNSIGGLPLLVMDGHPVDLHARCILEEGWCPDQYYPRARTAFGRTFTGEAIVLVAPEEWGVTLQTLSYLMVELGASEAINLDGGGSSQLWFAGDDLVYSARPVAEGLLVFSTLNPTIGDDHSINK
jgi:hypothetical protein